MTATIGHNNPPEPIGKFEAIQVHILDLYELAETALTGDPIATDEQAAQIEQLADDCLKAEQAAEAARKEEAKPFDDGKAAVQAKWKPLTEKAKAAKETARKALTPWKLALQAQREAEAAEQRRIAQEAADKARKAIDDANRGADLAARERAEELVKAAAIADKQATKAAKPVATGLRSFRRAEITDRRAALNHYVRTAPDSFVALIQTLADQDARADVATVPGVAFHIEKVAA